MNKLVSIFSLIILYSLTLFASGIPSIRGEATLSEGNPRYSIIQTESGIPVFKDLSHGDLSQKPQNTTGGHSGSGALLLWAVSHRSQELLCYSEGNSANIRCLIQEKQSQLLYPFHFFW